MPGNQTVFSSFIMSAVHPPNGAAPAAERRNLLMAVRIWILLSAVLAGAGWILSAVHALNRVGYAVCLAFTALLLVVWWRKTRWRPQARSARLWAKFRKRFKRPAPLFFLLTALLALGGGLATRPNNGDSDAYRIPRVLHWLAQGGWHWIHTGDSRMNISGCNFEWLSAPLILFTRTDRWLFLINALPYFLLPGLIFDVFRRLRIAPRVAWWWMWILASGWCFALQAGSTINDSLGVIYALAAVAFALRAGETGKAGDLWLSLLAVAELTGLKQTNLPLLLPWFIAAWPARRLWLKKPAWSWAVGAFSLLVSAATLSWLNWKYAGTWTGFPKNPAEQVFAWGSRQELNSPFWGVIGNIFCLPIQNLLPPFFPWASAWNAAMQHFLTTPLGAHFTQFEVFGLLGRSVTPSNAGIGLGIMVLTLASLWGAGRGLRFAAMLPFTGQTQKHDWHLRLLWIAPWIALLVFMAKVGTYQNARQMAAYYVLLFPVLLAGAGHAALVRRRWWQWLAVAVLCGTTAYAGFVYGRGLLPNAVVAQLKKKYPRQKFLSVFADYYSARASVEAQRGFLEKSGVTGEKIIGFATTCSGGEPGWWVPFGQRRIVRVLAADSPAAVRQQGIHYVVVEDLALAATHETIEQWAERYRGEVVNQVAFTKDPNTPLAHLYLVHLRE